MRDRYKNRPSASSMRAGSFAIAAGPRPADGRRGFRLCKVDSRLRGNDGAAAFAAPSASLRAECLAAACGHWERASAYIVPAAWRP